MEAIAFIGVGIANVVGGIWLVDDAAKDRTAASGFKFVASIAQYG